jgi:hypothetical protein
MGFDGFIIHYSGVYWGEEDGHGEGLQWWTPPRSVRTLDIRLWLLPRLDDDLTTPLLTDILAIELGELWNNFFHCFAYSITTALDQRSAYGWDELMVGCR